MTRGSRLRPFGRLLRPLLRARLRKLLGVVTGCLVLLTLSSHRTARYDRPGRSLSLMSPEDQEDTYQRLHDILTRTEPVEKYCAGVVPLGGRCFCYAESEEIVGQVDGYKFVCVDLLPRRDCTVMSFGINNDFSFDTDMTDLGCTVHAFDPTMNRTSGAVSERLFFHPVGIAAQDGWVGQFPVLSYTGALERVGWKDRIVDYLKLDVECSEWEVLEQQLALDWFDSQLARVRQLTVEFHLTSWSASVAGNIPDAVVGRDGSPGVDITPENAARFLTLLTSLKQAGFKLVKTTPYVACREYHNGCLPYIFETLWINSELS